QIVRIHRTHFQGLYGDFQVVNRTGRRSKMKNVVQITGNMYKFGHIVMIKLEVFQGHQVLNVPHIPRYEIVHSDNTVPFLNKAVAKMRAEKPGRSEEHTSELQSREISY